MMKTDPDRLSGEKVARFSIIRLLVTSALLIGVTTATWWTYKFQHDQREIKRLEALTSELEQRLRTRQDMIDRLTRTRRMAHIHIGEQITTLDGSIVSTELTMVEFDDDGREIGRQDFQLPGGTMFVDAWTIKFSHDDVAHGNPLAGRTLVLLKRIYSDIMTPREGLPIDLPGAVPPGYASSELGQYERRLWECFWRVATDSQLAEAMGVRVAQGEVVYKPVLKGESYELVVDADGGMSLVPTDGDTVLSHVKNTE